MECTSGHKLVQSVYLSMLFCDRHKSVLLVCVLRKYLSMTPVLKFCESPAPILSSDGKLPDRLT
jgi:hypothetical protein